MGEDAHDAGAALDLFVDALERVGRPDLVPVGLGNAANASTPALATSISGPTLA